MIRGNLMSTQIAAILLGVAFIALGLTMIVYRDRFAKLQIRNYERILQRELSSGSADAITVGVVSGGVLITIVSLIVLLDALIRLIAVSR